MLGNDPFSYDYDPLGSNAYQRYVKPPVPEPVPSVGGFSFGEPVAPAAEPAGMATLDDYVMARGGNPDAAYNDYVTTVLPAYLKAAGLNPTQQAQEMAAFKKLRPPRDLYDRTTSRIDAALSSALPGTSDAERLAVTDQAGMAKQKAKDEADAAKIEELRKEFGTEDAGWFRAALHATASGLVGMVGGAAQFAGGKGDIQWLKDVGEKTKLEAAARMKADPSFKDKLFSAGGSALGAIGVGAAALASGAPLWVAGAGAAVMGLVEGAGVGQETYAATLRNTGNEAEADKQAWKAFLLNAPISVIANKLAFFTAGGKTAATLFKGVVTQGAEEGAQTYLTNYLGYEKDVAKGMAESMLLGGLIGGPMAVITSPGKTAIAADLSAPGAPPSGLSLDSLLDAGVGKRDVPPAAPSVAPTPAGKKRVGKPQPVPEVPFPTLESFTAPVVAPTLPPSATTILPPIVPYVDTTQPVVVPSIPDAAVKPRPDPLPAIVPALADAAPDSATGVVAPSPTPQSAPAAVEQAAVSAQTAQSDPLPVLPPELTKADPRFGKYRLAFDSDIDKALYIIGRAERLSASDGDYLRWLQQEAFPGASEAALRQRGTEVRATVKQQATQAQYQNAAPATRLRVPGYASTPAVRRFMATATPRPSSPLSDIGTKLLDAMQGIDVDMLDDATVSSAIVEIENAVQAHPNAGNIEAALAVAEASPAAKPKRRASKPRAARPPQVDASGDPPVQPGLSRVAAGSTGSDGQSQRTGGESASAVRESVVPVGEGLRRPINEKTLEALALDMATSKHPEAKALSDVFYTEFEAGYGTPMVDMALVRRAHDIQLQAREAARLAKQGQAPKEVQDLFTDPDTGRTYEAPLMRAAMEDQPLHAAVRAKVLGDDITGALEAMAQTASSPIARAIAARLADVYMGAVQTRTGPLTNASGDAIAGRWTPERMLLEFDPEYLNEHVLLHEAAHVATTQLLSNPVTQDQRSAVRELEGIFQTTKRMFVDGTYAFKNVAEFVAEAMANPAFQLALSRMAPGTGQSLWKRFVGQIKRLLGIGNLLDDVAPLIEAIISTPTTQLAAVYDAPAAQAPVAGRQQIVIKRTNSHWSWLLDNQASITSAGQQIEKALEKSGIKLPDELSLRLQNTLKRSQGEAELRKWTERFWGPVVSVTQGVTQRFGKTVPEVEQVLVHLEVLGRAQAVAKQLDPSNTDYAAQLAKANAARAQADTALLALERTNKPFLDAVVKLAQTVKLATDATMDSRMAARNNMSAAQLMRLKSAYPNRYMPNGFYLPLQYDSKDGREISLLTSSTGQNFTADNPLARIFGQAALTVHSNESNRERQQLYALAKSFDLVDAATQKPLVEITPVAGLKRDPVTGQITDATQQLHLDDDAVGVWIDDKFVKMRINDPLLKSSLRPQFKAEPVATMAALIGVTKYVTMIMSVTRTALNPGFAMYNFMRDQMGAALYLDPKIRYGALYAALPRALASGFRNTFAGALDMPQSARFMKAMDDGAFISQRTYTGLSETVRDVSIDLAPTLSGRLKQAALDPLGTKLGRILTGVAQSLETATRLAIYDAAIASGLSPREAAYHAKTTTANFERRSDVTQALSPLYMFVNAKAQGVRTGIEKTIGPNANPRTQIGMSSMVALGLVAAYMGYEESDKDEDGVSKYKKIADYKRDTLIIMKEGSPGIPLAQEASLFYVLGNSIGDLLYGDSTVPEATVRIVKNLMQQVAPGGTAQTDPLSRDFSISDYFMRLVTPSAAVFPLDIATNKDTFGREIVPRGNQYAQKPPHKTFRRNENPTSIELAQTLYDETGKSVSPAQLTHFAKFVDGGSVKFWKDVFEPREPSYPGEETNPLLRRISTVASPFYDADAYKNAYDALSRQAGAYASDESRAANPAAEALYKQFKAFESRKGRTLFKGYANMTDAEIAEASVKADAVRRELMQQYNALPKP